MEISLEADRYKCVNPKCKSYGKYQSDEGGATTVVMYQRPKMFGVEEAPTLYYQPSEFADEPVTLLVSCIKCKTKYKVSPWGG